MYRTNRSENSAEAIAAARRVGPVRRLARRSRGLIVLAALVLPAGAASAAVDTALHSGADRGGELVQVTYHDRRHRHDGRRSRYSRNHRYRGRSHSRVAPRYRSRYSQPRYYSNGYRNNYRRGPAYSYRGYNRGYSRGYNNSCRRVTRRGYWHGRRALIGGRECVNARGYSYIAPNSRYLIRYR